MKQDNADVSAIVSATADWERSHVPVGNLPKHTHFSTRKEPHHVP
jgi:hypothetical protein